MNTIENQQVANSTVIAEDVSQTPIKFWKVSVFEKKLVSGSDKNAVYEKGERVENVYVEAKKRNWAERMGLICTADFWGYNTSDLMSEGEQIKTGKLNIKEFRVVMGTKLEEHDYGKSE